MGQCLAYFQQLLRGKGSYTDDTSKSSAMGLPDLDIPDAMLDQILGTVFGNCIGDAIGLITEFLIKPQATETFGSFKHFEYKMKEISGHKFFHQARFPTADWTDDSDQMILILLSLIENSGKIVPTDFGKRMTQWREKGFPELGDIAGMGCGATTYSVLSHKEYTTDPHKAAYGVWIGSGCNAAPNGGVMRTSILGIHNFLDIEKVIRNTLGICKVTHADPRCIASCVAVTTCIAMMLQGKHRSSDGSYDTQALTDDAYEYAKPYLNIYKDETHPNPYEKLPEFQAEELHHYMNMQNLEDLKLDERGKIGYTYKCLGAGFWAFRQKDFRQAIEALTREAGDADTNGAVAGALLGCKLGYKKLPKTWKEELIHKRWLEGHIYNYLKMDIMNPDATDEAVPMDTTQSDEEKKADESSSQDIKEKADEAAASADQNPTNKEGASESSTVDLSNVVVEEKRTESEEKSDKDEENTKRKEVK